MEADLRIAMNNFCNTFGDPHVDSAHDLRPRLGLTDRQKRDRSNMVDLQHRIKLEPAWHEQHCRLELLDRKGWTGTADDARDQQ